MKVAMYGYCCKDETTPFFEEYISLLQERNVEMIFEMKFYNRLKKHLSIPINYKTFVSNSDLDTSYDFFFSFGGDGTMLRSIAYVRDLGIPILGINTGRLGFLALVKKEEFVEALEMLNKKEYTTRERSLLIIRTNPKTNDLSKLDFALNEVTVGRKNTTSMIKITTFINDNYLTSYWADGLIVSTPTGSTGYSLSCGGPIITPSSETIALTPIAPHNLNVRALVIQDDIKITLSVTGREKTFLMSLDSKTYTLKNETEIFIEKAPFKIKTVQLNHQSFLKTLRNKLMWGEDPRN
ncbi:MAG TPA: NAD kinase [Flavobacteriaceae bacterium]|nr:NAD kinase [Flavobacteriaceae bacterium]HEX5743301.1 NAD kinase [Flavobacteriaceae bacterium]